MSQSAATFFGFWEGVRGSQYQNQLPNGAVVELRQAGAKHKGGAGGGGLFGPQGPGNPTAPSPSDPCIEDTMPMPYVASKTPEDCYDYCRLHADNLSGYAACLFNCYGGAIGEGGCACPSGDGPYFSLPDFQQVHLVTQLCFAIQYGNADWPETCCCPPPLNATSDCSPPTELECALMRWAIPCREWVDDQPPSTLKNDRYGAATPTEADRELFGAGIAVLLKNMDVVLWLSCLVQNWSPELRGLDLSRYILQLLTPDDDGQFPLTVSYVERPNPEGAHMWAYTVATQCTTTLRDPFGMVQFHLPCRVGVIVAVSHDNWTRRMRAWRSGGTAAFCAAVQVASEVLHEIVHILGDGYDSGVVGAEDSTLYPTYPDEKYGTDPSHNINEAGTLHEQMPDPNSPIDSIHFPTPCWDEGRMLGTMLLWAMSQRYTCLVSNNCCSFMDRPEYFAYSTGTVCQLGAKCFESSCS